MTTVLGIRTAKSDDARTIASVLFDSFAEYEPLYTPEAFAATTPNEAVIKKRFDQAGEIWVAVSGEKIVGTATAVPDGDALYVRSMAVLPEARGAGIGLRLLMETENYAARAGFERLTLTTTPFLRRAIELYEKFGFAACGSSDLYGTPLIKMEKKLL